MDRCDPALFVVQIEQNMAKKCEEMGYIYECFDCGRRFVSKVNVSRHMPHCVGVRGINPNRRGG